MQIANRYSVPGSEGGLPNDFAAWRQGVTYTVHPRFFARLASDEEYRVNVTTRITHPQQIATDYADLYARARSLADARVAQVASQQGVRVATWVVAHAWFAHTLGAARVSSATVTFGIMLPEQRVVSIGERYPTDGELAAPSGGTAEAFAAKHSDELGNRALDEMWTEFGTSSSDVTISYGEYIGSQVADYRPIIQRAEQMREFYSRLRNLMSPTVMREWDCIDTGKQHSLPYLATVHFYLR